MGPFAQDVRIMARLFLKETIGTRFSPRSTNENKKKHGELWRIRVRVTARLVRGVHM